MSQKVVYFSAIILLIIFKFSDHLYFEPDLENPSIPQKWRELCGFRIPAKKLVFPKKCFVHQIKDRFIPFPNALIDPMNRVLRGRDVRYRESPWAVQIAWRECKISPGTLGKPGQICEDSFCTGVLLTMKHVLTAAHCWNSDYKYKVFVGNDQSLPHFSRVWSTKRIQFHTHPGYIHDTYHNDIGIITFETPIDWDKYGRNKTTGQFIINTICLPKPHNSSNTQTSLTNPQKATLFGFGLTGDRPATVLQRGDYLVRYESDPVTHFDTRAEENSQRICSGDSGSGLVQYIDDYGMRAVLIGIHSRTDNRTNDQSCDFEDTTVHRAVDVVDHLQWINERLNEN